VIGSVSNEANKITTHTHTHTEESRACMHDHSNMTGGLINSAKDSDYCRRMNHMGEGPKSRPERG